MDGRLRIELFEARQAVIDFQEQTGRGFKQCIRDLIILARLYREYRLTGDPSLLAEIEEYEGDVASSPSGVRTGSGVQDSPVGRIFLEQQWVGGKS